QVQGRQEVFALDPVSAPPGLEDGDRERLVERIDVAVVRPGGHAGELCDLGDRHALLATARSVQDRRDPLETREAITLAPGALVGALVLAPLVGRRISLHRPDGTPRRGDEGPTASSRLVRNSPPAWGCRHHSNSRPPAGSGLDVAWGSAPAVPATRSPSRDWPRRSTRSG